VQFSRDGLFTTIHLSPDLETCGPHSILQLIEFFKPYLSIKMFWPE
jgi:hypothetical protein